MTLPQHQIKKKTDPPDEAASRLIEFYDGEIARISSQIEALKETMNWFIDEKKDLEKRKRKAVQLDDNIPENDASKNGYDKNWKWIKKAVFVIDRQGALTIDETVDAIVKLEPTWLTNKWRIRKDLTTSLEEAVKEDKLIKDGDKYGLKS